MIEFVSPTLRLWAGEDVRERPGFGVKDKIGRNDICPCGSGKKFKKCHLGRERELGAGGMGEISPEISRVITSLPEVDYGRAFEIRDELDLKNLTGSKMGIKFIDLKRYSEMDLSGGREPGRDSLGGGGVVINPLKTSKSDPDNVYIAISRNIHDSGIAHELAHVLDYLGGSRLMPGMAKPLSYDLGVPTEHLEHPREFGYWLEYLRDRFDLQLDADDKIITYLFEEGMLIEAIFIEKQDVPALKEKSDRILRFLSERSEEVNEMIRELPGYIGPRKTKE